MINNVTFKEKIFLSVAFLYIIYIIFPLFADITGIPVYLPALLVVTIISILYPHVYKTKLFLWFFVYIGVISLYIVFGKHIHINGLGQGMSPWNKLVIEAAWILPSMFIAEVLALCNSVKLYKSISYGSMILLVISFLYVLPMLSANANCLREDMSSLSRPIGLPGYDLMHAYALMIFPLALCTKNNNGIIKLIYAFLVILFSYIVTKTAVTTSLFLTLFTFVVVLIYSPNNRTRTVLMALLCCFIILLLSYTGAFQSILEFLMPHFYGTAVYDKLQDMHESLLKGYVVGDTISGRVDYHAQSIAAFARNPLIGSQGVGGHSKFMDVLGSMGIFGFVPYIMILVYMLKSYQLYVSVNTTKVYLFLSFVFAGVFLYTKGIFGGPGYLFMFVIVPSMVMLIDKGE